MERQVNHLVRLVDDLLEVSRITRGRIELRMETVELAAVARNAIETSRPLIDAAGLQLAISLPQDPIMLDGDPIRLAQVFANLLNNAAKYTDRGGQIWFSAKRGRKRRRDHGPRSQASAFQRSCSLKAVRHVHAGRPLHGPFARRPGHRPHARSQPGRIAFGVGRVYSAGPGCGSEFRVRLPIQTPSRHVHQGSFRQPRRVNVLPSRNPSWSSTITSTRQKLSECC